MKEEKEFDLFAVLLVVLLVVALITGVGGIVDYYVKPATKYHIDTDNGYYYANSYQVDNGFIELNDYYHGFVFYSHHTTELILQGNIKITEEGK
jgi:hypothetical protein